MSAAVFLGGLGVALFSSAGRDDAHITYWAAFSLAESGTIANYNGAAVEQSSSLLHLWLLAGLTALTRSDLVTVGKLTGLLFGAGSVLWTYRLARELHPDSGAWAAWLAATSTPLVYWSLGGLETTVASFFALAAILSLAGWQAGRQGVATALAPAGAVLAFLLTRPESPFVMVATQAGVLCLLWTKTHWHRESWEHRSYQPRALRALAATLVCALGIAVMRMWWFDQALPQPVSAKSAGWSIATLREGVRYAVSDATPYGWGRAVPFVLAGAVLSALLTEVKSPRANLYRLYALAFVFSQSAFILLSGGDWMEGGRFFVPMVTVVAALSASELTRLLHRSWRLPLVMVVLVGVQVAGSWSFAAAASTGLPLRHELRLVERYRPSDYSWFERNNRVSLREIPVIAHLDDVLEQLLRRPSPVTIMTGQMGMVAYHVTRKRSGQLRWLDRYGLTDRTLTRCPLTASLPRTRLGLWLPYPWFFEHQKELELRCGIGSPDVIFDIDFDHQNARAVEAGGYSVVFVQTGAVGSGSEALPGAYVHAEEFVAVRRELLPFLDSQTPTRVAFEDLVR